MKSMGVMFFAIVTFTSFTGIICNPVNTEIEPDCFSYNPIPGIGLACNRMYKPVCGTNGQTYSNECELCSYNMKFSKDIKIKIKHRFSCNDKSQDECQGFGEMCTFDHRPVCGSDAVTYSNKCMFCGAKKRNADLLLVSEGECEPKSQDECQGFGEMCTSDYRPVCGSDAVTYSNKCMFCGAKKRNADLLLVSEGECEPKSQDECQGFGEMCTFDHRPVCGSDAVTYSNKCMFCGAKKRNADLLLVSEGECEPKSQDECQGFGEMCTFDYRPVCGSDAVTYSNKCMFCGAKKRNAELTLVSVGKCSK